MKPNVFVIVAVAVLGFGAGWIAKPVPAPRAEVAKSPRPRPTVPPPVTSLPDVPSAPPPLHGGIDSRAPSPDPQQDDVSEQVKSRDDAKLARLAEALNLNDEQKAAIIHAMNAAEGIMKPETTPEPGKALEVALDAAVSIEKAVTAALTPEQAAAFAALRKRSEDNTIESTAQARVNDLAKLSDLSEEQREKIAGLIREDVRSSYQNRPKSLDLVLDTSVMPIGSSYIANSSVDRLLFDAGKPADNATHQAYIDRQRQNLDRQFETYKSLLTPAQQERLRIDIEERKQALERVSGFLR